jgi:hypothetical protein
LRGTFLAAHSPQVITLGSNNKDFFSNGLTFAELVTEEKEKKQQQ